LRYVPEFISAAAEAALLSDIERLPFESVRMHGVDARREVVHFGVRYRFDGGVLAPAPPILPFGAVVAGVSLHAP